MIGLAPRSVVVAAETAQPVRVHFTCFGAKNSLVSFVDVNESPDKFQDAYWTVNAVRAYVPGANSTSTSGSSGGTGGNSTLSTNQSGSGPESSTLSGDGASGTVGATASKTGGSKPTKC